MVRTFARVVPPWLWLGAIVLASIAGRLAISGRTVAPWIMIDELVYSELAKNFAAHGRFLIRGVPSSGYGFVYPALIAPAWRIYSSIPSAYSAAKAINTVLMSLAAVPGYHLARRLLPARLSLVVAALTVLVPSMLYTDMLMTENAFYPIFLLVALQLVRMLERPTVLGQIGLLVACGVAFETRAQAVALLPAVAVAPVALALLERRGLRAALRSYAALYGTLAAAAALALIGTIARGRSPLTLLGAYRAATSSNYTVSGILHFLLYHVAELDLYLGIVPFAALVAMWLAPGRLTPSGRAFAVATFAISFFLLVEVAAFASQGFVDRIEERNMFYLAPFALVAMLGLATDAVVPTSRRVVIAAAALAGVLPVFIPFARFITTSALSDTFALLPWWWAQDHFVTLDNVRYAAFGVSIVLAAVFVLLPRRFALVLPVLLAVYFVATSFVVENGRHGIRKTTVGDLWAGTHLPHPNWIDREVGPKGSVSVLWTGTLGDAYPLWENEFFSRSVHTVYDVNDAGRPDPLPMVAVERAPDGKLVDDGHPISATYVLTDTSLDLAGKLVKEDPVGVDLYRVDGPVIILTHISGLYPSDTWSGKTVTYQRVRCTGGRLTVELQGDSHLFTRPQTVVVTEAGRIIAHTTVPVTGTRKLTVPLQAAGGRCVVRYTVGRTIEPAGVEPGSIDTRRLGTHFVLFSYKP